VRCAIILVALVAGDRLMAAHEAAARRANIRVGRFITREEREGKHVAAVRIQDGTRRPELYISTQGMWRCATYHGAVASTDRITGLVEAIFEADGNVQSTDPAHAPDYGFVTGTECAVTLHGPRVLVDPAHDMLFSFDLGNPTGDKEGCYVRRHGTSRVWAIDTNPRQMLAPRTGTDLPALLDPDLVPAAWLSSTKSIEHIAVRPEGGPSLELVLHHLKVNPEDMRMGKPESEWVLEGNGTERPTNRRSSMSFATYVLHAPFADVLDAAAYKGMENETARAALTLLPGEGAPLELRLENETSRGRPIVFNTVTHCVYEIEPDEAGLLFPTEVMLASPTRDPWAGWLELWEGLQAAQGGIRGPAVGMPLSPQAIQALLRQSAPAR